MKVQYMDYGNTESLSPDQVYELPEPYLSAEMLAVPCRLYQWPENVTGIYQGSIMLRQPTLNR